MKREFAEAARFARHVRGRGFEAARSALAEVPAAITVAIISIGLPLGLSTIVAQVIQ